MAESTHDHLFKLLIIGDSGVGKSSILLRFCGLARHWLGYTRCLAFMLPKAPAGDDEFNEKQASTIGLRPGLCCRVPVSRMGVAE